MNANLSLVMHFLCIVSVVTLAFAVICAVLARPFLRWANRFESDSRLVFLRLFAVWPLFGGFAVGAMVSLPSLRHISKLPLDHCHNDGGCFGQAISHMLTIGEFSIVTVLLGVLAWATIKANLQWRRASALARQIDEAAHGTLATGVKLIESTRPLAFSLGLPKSIAVLSTALVRALTTRQLDIICVHEQVHIRHHDNWYKWVLRILCSVHFPDVKHELLSEHAAALELRADQQVARHIQDPIAVAETIVAMQRLIKPFSASEPLCQFAGNAVERRVQHLLAATPGRSLPKYSAILFRLTAIVVFIVGATPLHDTLESLMN